MSNILKETKWAIMDKTRAIIVRGTSSDRKAVRINDTTCKMAMSLYSSKASANAGLTKGYLVSSAKYEFGDEIPDFELEPVEVIVTIKDANPVVTEYCDRCKYLGRVLVTEDRTNGGEILMREA